MAYKSPLNEDVGDLETGSRVCRHCLQRKSMAEFNRVERGRYRQRVCKPCVQKRVGRNRDANPSRHAAQRRKWWLKERYGLTPAEFEAMLVDQEGRCRLCMERLTKVTVRIDHDHQTGAVRGLLCHNCNLGLGYFRDDPHALDRAAAYLRRVEAEQAEVTWMEQLRSELAGYGVDLEDTA